MTPGQVAKSGYQSGYKDGVGGHAQMRIVSRQIKDATGPGTETTRLFAWAYEVGYEQGTAERQRRLQP